MRVFFCLSVLSVLCTTLAHAVTTGTAGGAEPIDLGQPYQDIQYIIAVEGAFPLGGVSPSRYEDRPVLGEIRLFLGEEIPEGWLPCDGRTISISLNPPLFASLDTKYGGNGTTHFRIPDLRGRVPVGAGPGLPAGTIVGGGPATLTPDQLPPHAHPTEEAPTEAIGLGTPVDNQLPGLALHIYIKSNTIFAEIGDLLILAGRPYQDGFENFVPLDGATYAFADKVPLYAKLQDIPGTKIDNATFRVPNLVNRAIVQRGEQPGMTDRFLGEAFGTSELQLSEGQLPSHDHSFGAGTTAKTGDNLPIPTWQDTLALAFYVYPFESVSDTSFIPGEVIISAASTYIEDSEIYSVPLNGQSLSIVDPQHSGLYEVIGHRYGGSPGEGIFNVPNFIGRVPRGGSAGTLGETGGNEFVFLSPSQMPAHQHAATALQPTVHTTGASAVGFTTATLEGTVNPRGFPANPYFEVGAGTEAKEELAAGESPLAGTAPVDISTELSGLEPETTYFFNTGARNASHNIRGPILQFTTGTYLDQWRDDVFGTTEINEETADLAVPFNDNISNLLRFATATPVNTNKGLPRAEQTPEGALSIVYQRRAKLGQSVQVVVEWSTLLEADSWQTEGVIETIIHSEDGIETISARLPETPEEQQFGRLRVIRTE